MISAPVRPVHFSRPATAWAQLCTTGLGAALPSSVAARTRLQPRTLTDSRRGENKDHQSMARRGQPGTRLALRVRLLFLVDQCCSTLESSPDRARTWRENGPESTDHTLPQSVGFTADTFPSVNNVVGTVETRRPLAPQPNDRWALRIPEKEGSLEISIRGDHDGVLPYLPRPNQIRPDWLVGWRVCHVVVSIGSALRVKAAGTIGSSGSSGRQSNRSRRPLHPRKGPGPHISN